MLNSIIGTDLTLSAFLICTAASLVLGIGLAFVSQFRARSTQSFAVTLAILPMVVQVVIMLVNGNIGAGVAVAGAFSLVRFRSAPGTAREIGVLFLGMAIGLATGMGYVGLAALTFVIVSTALLALTALGLGQKDAGERLLKITIPEDLDYEGLFVHPVHHLPHAGQGKNQQHGHPVRAGVPHHPAVGEHSQGIS